MGGTVKPPAMEKVVDFVVIGAGISGLSAAYQLWLKDPSLSVVVLEAKDRVGGRTVGRQLKALHSDTDTWDLGGQWVGSTQPQVMQLIQELGLETYSEHLKGKRLMQLGGDTVRSYHGDIPSLPWLSLLDLHFFISKLEKMAKTIDVEDPANSKNACQWDCITFDQFMRKHIWTQAAHDAICAAGRCIFGVEPEHCSLLYYLSYMRTAGGLNAIISAEPGIGGQEFKVKGGAWRISHCLVDRIDERNVHLNTVVTRIHQTESSVTVTTEGKTTYRCDRAIIALPPHLATKIEYSPALPVEKLQVMNRMAPGDITKIIVTFKKAFWRDAGLCGEVVTSGGPSIVEGCSTGPLCIIFDAMSGHGNPALVAFIGGIQQVQYSKVEASLRQRAVLHSLSQFFGDGVFDFLDYCELNWNQEPYNGGGPVSVATPGIMRSLPAGLRLPVGRLHFAGTESATVWPGFMNGAVQSGYRAANEVLYNLRPQVLSGRDLDGSAYDARRETENRIKERQRTRLPVLRWAVGLGFLCAAFVVGRKVFFSTAF